MTAVLGGREDDGERELNGEDPGGMSLPKVENGFGQVVCPKKTGVKFHEWKSVKELKSVNKVL